MDSEVVLQKLRSEARQLYDIIFWVWKLAIIRGKELWKSLGASYFPYTMFVWWGKDMIMFHNDTHVPVLGKRFHPVQVVLRLVNRRGFNCSKNQLWRILRNPFYYGKILPVYKDGKRL